MSEVLIKVDRVSKKFCKDLKTSLKYGVQDLTAQIFGKDRNQALRDKEFWAVNDISFEVKRGECLGLIGHNGAGKSTLLKMLNGLIQPDKGRIEMQGRIGALIELGAGFSPILTGRENIYNNAAILGFTKKEVDTKIEEIIAFSEICEFIDMPVQYYSSGMKVRLGFAIAAQMQPDILIIDEVLAVGDLGFVLKCFKKIDEIIPNTAMIFVSHSMPLVSRICNEIILMDKGQVKFQGEHVAKGIDMYYSQFRELSSGNEKVFDSGDVKFISTNITDETANNGVYNISWGQSIQVQFLLKCLKPIKRPYISLVVYDKEQRGIAEIFPPNQILTKEYQANNDLEYTINLNNLYLSKGLYFITLNISEAEGKNPILKIHKILVLQVVNSKQYWTPYLIDSNLI